MKCNLMRMPEFLWSYQRNLFPVCVVMSKMCIILYSLKSDKREEGYLSGHHGVYEMPFAILVGRYIISISQDVHSNYIPANFSFRINFK